MKEAKLSVLFNEELAIIEELKAEGAITEEEYRDMRLENGEKLPCRKNCGTCDGVPCEHLEFKGTHWYVR